MSLGIHQIGRIAKSGKVKALLALWLLGTGVHQNPTQRRWSFVGLFQTSGVTTTFLFICTSRFVVPRRGYFCSHILGFRAWEPAGG